jgi:hypothetical protein
MEIGEAKEKKSPLPPPVLPLLPPPVPSLISVCHRRLPFPPFPDRSTTSSPSPVGSAPSPPSPEVSAFFKADELAHCAPYIGGLAYGHLRRWWVTASDVEPAPPPSSMSALVLLRLLPALPPPPLPHGGPPTVADERPPSQRARWPPPHLGPLSRTTGCLRGERICNFASPLSSIGKLPRKMHALLESNLCRNSSLREAKAFIYNTIFVRHSNHSNQWQLQLSLCWWSRSSDKVEIISKKCLTKQLL